MNLSVILTSAADTAANVAANNGAAAVTPTDAAAAAGCMGAGGTSGWTLIIMYAVIIAVCYFFLIRPQKKRRQQEEAMQKSVEVGDEITTIGGICGRVVSVKDDDTIVLETSVDRCKLKMKTWAISVNETARERQAAAQAAAKANQPEKKGLAALFSKKDK